jgi:hypothetical protein
LHLCNAHADEGVCWEYRPKRTQTQTHKCIHTCTSCILGYTNYPHISPTSTGHICWVTTEQWTPH